MRGTCLRFRGPYLGLLLLCLLVGSCSGATPNLAQPGAGAGNSSRATVPAELQKGETPAGDSALATATVPDTATATPVDSPTPTSTFTPEPPSPTPTNTALPPTATATNTRVPTPAPKPVAPTATIAPPTATSAAAPPTNTPQSSAGVQFLYVNGGRPGATASVGVQTAPGASCIILYYTPLGNKSEARGLGPEDGR